MNEHVHKVCIHTLSLCSKITALQDVLPLQLTSQEPQHLGCQKHLLRDPHNAQMQRRLYWT